ncbi:MAG: phosphoribosylformylglycinamidine cyclo-ligase, partial [bacterium]
QSDCALVGGETAEMPSFYQDDEYDCAGFVVGVVDEDKIIDGSKIKEGDVVLGIESSGIHSNGYSLVRNIFFNKNSYTMDHVFPELDAPLGEVLLRPTQIYVKPVIDMVEAGFNIKAMCHVTGGGITENLPRVLADRFSAEIELNKINVLPIFKLMAKLGQVETEEMMRVFNMGVGFIMVLPQNEADKAMKTLSKYSLRSSVIGKIIDDGKNKVVFSDLDKFKL